MAHWDLGESFVFALMGRMALAHHGPGRLLHTRVAKMTGLRVANAAFDCRLTPEGGEGG